MGQRNAVFKSKIKQKGYWSYDGLYLMCFEWLGDNGYEVAEDEYTEKVVSNGKEIYVTWSAYKKVTDYLKNHIILRWKILGMKDVEVEQEGKKVSTNKGEVSIEVKGELEKDYEGKWEDAPLWKMMRGVYDKYIVRTTIEQYEERIWEDADELANQIKGFLNLTTTN